MFLLVLSVTVFLVLSGLMAAVDAAVLSVTRPEIGVLIKQRKWGARRLSRVKQEITRSVVVIVILTNTINVLGPIVVSQQALDLYGNQGIVIITAVLTLGTIVFSEIVPKALGSHYAPLIARFAAPPIQAGRYLLYPLVIAFGWLSNQFTKGRRHIGTEEQIRSLVRIGHRAGYIESDEDQLIHRAFILNDKSAGEIMTPLHHVKALGAGFTINQAIAEVNRSEFSRYPVFGKSVDNVQGIALSRDVFKAAVNQSAEALSSIIRPAVVVEAQIKSDELLTLFRDQHIHLAVVQDLKKTVGVVTLEDVLEELVGDIKDEKDVGGSI
ncbi:MAG: HlyC/CorC family transporter [Pirellulaceae bacterium]|nr:HlyC/CorC family transporter [Pirellulaceae bacterium]